MGECYSTGTEEVDPAIEQGIGFEGLSAAKYVLIMVHSNS